VLSLLCSLQRKYGFSAGSLIHGSSISTTAQLSFHNLAFLLLLFVIRATFLTAITTQWDVKQFDGSPPGLYLFGGLVGERHNDLFQYNLDVHRWIQLRPMLGSGDPVLDGPTRTPSGREKSAAVYLLPGLNPFGDGSSGALAIVGGRGRSNDAKVDGRLADMWSFDLLTKVWTPWNLTESGIDWSVSPPGAIGTADDYYDGRERHEVVRIGRELFLYAGVASGFRGDVFVECFFSFFNLIPLDL